MSARILGRVVAGVAAPPFSQVRRNLILEDINRGQDFQGQLMRTPCDSQADRQISQILMNLFMKRKTSLVGGR